MPLALTLAHGAAEQQQQQQQQQQQARHVGPPQAQAQAATSGRPSSPSHTSALTGPAGGPAGRDVWLSLPGLWPYWMDRRDAVLNDLQLRAGSMALLTGPNMAGGHGGMCDTCGRGAQRTTPLKFQPHGLVGTMWASQFWLPG